VDLVKDPIGQGSLARSTTRIDTGWKKFVILAAGVILPNYSPSVEGGSEFIGVLAPEILARGMGNHPIRGTPAEKN
jgi:hypothetical protein